MIRGAGGGGDKKQRAPIESPDSLRSTAFATILDLLGEGETQGFANQEQPLTCMFLNETPIQNADGTFNFKNVQVDSRTGTQVQDYIKGFDTVENEISVGVELTSTTPWTRSFSNVNISAIRIRLSTPALSVTNVTNGDITGHSVSYRIELSTDGGTFVSKLTSAFTGKTSSKYERTHRIDLPAAVTSWVVRVVRITPNSDASSIQDTTVIESYAELIDAKLRMPMSALVSLKIDAEQFNNIPSRAFRWKGRIIKVPSNYNPDTGIYTGIWDGTFQSRYSTNPAWCFYDIVLNNRYGLGHLVSAALIDKWALYNIGVYCDGLVDNGAGGLERRFTCNLYLQTRNDAYRVLQDMATMFRGIMYAAGGAITAVGDMPSDPVYTYTQANVIDGEFVYMGSGRKVRHTVALVSWNDMTDFARAKVEYISDEEGIARYGIQETEVIAVGCTSRGQARRMGKYILTTERYETDGVAFSVGLDGTIPAPGKIIMIADPLRAGRRIGGRVRVATLNTITVDSLPIVAIGDTLTVTLPTGITQDRVVDSIVGNVIGVSVAFTGVPVPHSTWMVQSTTLSAQRFRVLGIAENDGGMSYSISAVQHVEGKFAFVEQNIAIVLPPITSNALPAAPNDVLLTTFLRVGHGTAHTIVNADWENVVGAAKYEIQWRKDGGPWSAGRVKSDSSDDYEGAFAGSYVARVWAISPLGLASGITYSNTIRVVDSVLPIFNLVISGGVVTVDCRYSQFKLHLTEEVTNVVFTNVAPQDTIVIEVTQGGAFTINFGPSVPTVTGEVYVTTPVAGAVDMLGLATNNSGVTWQMTVQQPVGGEGGVGGSPTVTITPNPAATTSNTDGVTPVSPAILFATSVAGGTLPITHLWSRADAAGGANFNIDNATSGTPTISMASGTNTVSKVQTWRDTVTDAAGLTGQTTVEITLNRVSPAPPVQAAVSVAPNPAYGYAVTTGHSGTEVSTEVFATRTGMVGPFTQNYVKLSGAAISATFKTSGSDCTFARFGSFRSVRTAVFRHTTTDLGNGNATYTQDVTVELEIEIDAYIP